MTLPEKVAAARQALSVLHEAAFDAAEDGSRQYDAGHSAAYNLAAVAQNFDHEIARLGEQYANTQPTPRFIPEATP